MGQRSRQRSQCDLILDELLDGEWHTTAELIEAVPSIVHSRISDLRKKGYLIVHEATGSGARGSRYRLVDQAQLFIPLEGVA